MPEATTVKLKVQWRPQEVGDARNVEHLLKKSHGSKAEPDQNKVWAAASEDIGVRPLKPSGTHILPHYAIDAGHKPTSFSVFPAGVWATLIQLFSIPLIFPFSTGMFTLCYCTLDYVTCS